MIQAAFILAIESVLDMQLGQLPDFEFANGTNLRLRVTDRGVEVRPTLCGGHAWVQLMRLALLA
jgi:hypothetical protein